MSKWVRAEIMIPRQCAGTMRVADIGHLAGITRDAVRTKARELNVCLILRGDNQTDNVKCRDLSLPAAPQQEKDN